MNILKSIGIKLFVLVTIVMFFLASQFKSPTANEKGLSESTTYPVPDSQFIIGAFHNAADTGYAYQSEMKFNTWHQYTGPYWGWLNYANDRYDTTISLYENHVTTIIDKNNNQKGMRTLMDRPIIQYLVGGQRIDYQCEQIDSGFVYDPYWFYAYRYSVNNNINIEDINDNTRYGNGEKVKRCLTTPQSKLDGYVIIDSNLRSNREMSFKETNPWMQDSAYEWYALPRIRIDSAYAADVNHIDDEVCKIVFTGWSGNVEAEFVLKVSSFKKDFSTSYNGNYMESFYDSSQTLEYLLVPQSKLRNFTDTNIFTYEWNALCSCDIKVYWSGKCDMWIDRVRIENRPAHQYLTLKEGWLYEKMKKEIEWSSRNYSSGNPIPNYFYFEESQMSHFPIISALNKQIMDSTVNKNELVIWLNYDLFKVHVPNCWGYMFDSVMLKKYLYDDYGLRNIVMGSYALEGWRDDEFTNDLYRHSFHPSTLLNSDYSERYGILSNHKSPAEYDTWLQDHFDDPVHLSGVNYSYISKLMFSLSKEPGMRVLNCPQAHLWYAAGHKLKEPSNEELELMANLALTNNAKGLIWFSYVCEWTTIGSDYFARGIMDNGGIPRDSNVYYQNKYLKICQLDSMLEKRGPYIMSFEPTLTKNCTYRNSDDRYNFLTQTYFADIVTYKPGNTTPNCNEDNPGESNPPNLVYECKIDRYLQAATFKTSTSDINKYFMIVNRRCSPYIDESSEDNRGGRRNVRIRFYANSSEFSGYDNWGIFCMIQIKPLLYSIKNQVV